MSSQSAYSSVPLANTTFSIPIWSCIYLYCNQNLEAWACSEAALALASSTRFIAQSFATPKSYTASSYSSLESSDETVVLAHQFLQTPAHHKIIDITRHNALRASPRMPCARRMIQTKDP